MEIEKQKRVDELIKKVCDHYSVTLEDLEGSSRKESPRDARNLLMYILHKVLKITCYDVGLIFNRNYSTVLNAAKKISGWIEFDKEYAEFTANIIND